MSLGTSNSMGVQAAGVNAAGQRAAWPAQLASRVGVPYSLPLIQDPGCSPPLLAPLAANLILVAGFAALGEDLVSAVMDVCMPLRPGITLPTNNVAISGAKARDALHTTPEHEAAHNPTAGELYHRVLLPGQTQVTAMLAQNPTFVSVELAANEVLAGQHRPCRGDDAVRGVGARLRSDPRRRAIHRRRGGPRRPPEQRGELPQHPPRARVLQRMARPPRRSASG